MGLALGNTHQGDARKARDQGRAQLTQPTTKVLMDEALCTSCQLAEKLLNQGKKVFVCCFKPYIVEE